MSRGAKDARRQAGCAARRGAGLEPDLEVESGDLVPCRAKQVQRDRGVHAPWEAGHDFEVGNEGGAAVSGARSPA